jgi:hypothetical protein
MTVLRSVTKQRLQPCARSKEANGNGGTRHTKLPRNLREALVVHVSKDEDARRVGREPRDRGVEALVELLVERRAGIGNCGLETRVA